MKDKIRFLFVCTGNICRSPTAEVVMNALAQQYGLSNQLEVDSAGTHSYHVGEGADPRSVRHGTKRGYDFSRCRSRKVTRQDFLDFDFILAMDRGHAEELNELAFPGQKAQVRLFLQGVSEAKGKLDTPDPYYGGDAGFEEVLDLCEAGCRKLLREVFPQAFHESSDAS